VYAATRTATEEVAAELLDAGIDAAAYHAGIRARDRHDVQERFSSGSLAVVVATSAFGMGIDRADVRFVFHHAVSGSLDEYYQEVGRAGRDDEPADAILFHLPKDLGLRRFQSSGPALDPALVGEVAGALGRHRDEDGTDRSRVAEELGVRPRRLERALFFLERRGVAELLADDRVAVADEPDTDALVRAATDEAERIRRVRASRVEMMRSYAEGQTCRRSILLSYFGEPFEPPCGNCDVCAAASGDVHVDDTLGLGHVRVGDAVRHPEWGEGVLLRVSDDRVVAQFASVGYRTMSRALVEQDRLLRPA
jgi:ATP-dependent DNA helicase RecQ